MREHSLVKLTEHDNSAADIMVHSMYIYMYCFIHSIICTGTTVVTHIICILYNTADDVYVCIAYIYFLCG